MRALIVHKSEVDAGFPGADELRALCADAGHAATVADVKGDWRDAIARADLVVAAGGDGTVAAVARTLARHAPDAPLAILPLGTANNVARSLGIVAPPPELVAGWASAAERPFDVGVMTVAGDEASAAWFVEAVGVGLFARALEAAGARRGRTGAARATPAAGMDPSVAHGLRTLRRQARRLAAHGWRIELDGRPLEGRWLLAEALNVPRVGPHLVLAPDADTGDGLLDVALLHERDRDAFADYADRRLAGDDTARPPVTVHRARDVVIGWDGAPAHVDDDPWPGDDEAPAMRATRARPIELALRVGRTLRLLDPVR
jgi:diacylglycerol kinase family enzyme